VSARFKAQNVSASSNTGIVGSNPARGMDACLHLFCVCVVLCRKRPCEGLPTVCRIHNIRLILKWEQARGPNPSKGEEGKEEL
jgi:hypothetical protein